MPSAEQTNNATKPNNINRNLSKKRRNSQFIANTAAIYDDDDDNDYDSSSSLSSESHITDDDSLQGCDPAAISSSASPMLPSGGNNLLQVQNFLNCFDETGKQQHQHNKDELIKLTNNNYRGSHKNKININSHNNNNSVSNSGSQSKGIHRSSSSTSKDGSYSRTSSGRPQKFTISTKFLRRSRNKLRTASGSQSGTMPPTGGMSSMSSTAGVSMTVAASVGVSDDSNAKFKDFSIDSLLNK